MGVSSINLQKCNPLIFSFFLFSFALVFIFNKGQKYLNEKEIARDFEAPWYERKSIIQRPLFGYENVTGHSLAESFSPSLTQLMSPIYRNLSKFFIDDYVEWHNQTVHKINAGVLDPKDVRVVVH